MGNKTKPRILLIEDNPGDVRLVREALSDVRIAHDVCVAGDGEAAVRALRGEDEYAAVPRPNLVLLDLNLPKKGGLQVLTAMKSDDCLRHIPVVVLTTSDTDRDVVEAYHLHANCYVRKPAEYGVFAEVIRSLMQFWFGIVTLPRRIE